MSVQIVPTPFDEEINRVNARLNDGETPELYRRLKTYRDGLSAARNVLLIYRSKFASDEAREETSEAAGH